MCELHFVPEDIERETSHFDERTGTKLTAKLKIPRLRKGAVPSLLPNCPSYLSRPPLLRESPEGRRCRKEQDAMQAAIAQSITDDAAHRETRKFSTLNELSEKLVSLDKYWKVVKLDKSLVICNILCKPHPEIKLSVLIDNNCAVTVYADGVEMHRLGNFRIPSHVNDIDSLEKVLDYLRKCNTEERPSTPERDNFLM